MSNLIYLVLVWHGFLQGRRLIRPRLVDVSSPSSFFFSFLSLGKKAPALYYCCLPWTLAQYLWECLSSSFDFIGRLLKLIKRKYISCRANISLYGHEIWFYWFLLVRLNFYQLKIRFLLLHRQRSLSMLNRRSTNSTFITASNEAISCLKMIWQKLLACVWCCLW